MRRLLMLGMVLGSLTGVGRLEAQTVIEGLKNPESITVGFDNRVFITEIGEFGKEGDGRVLELVKGKAVPFATGLDDPKGIVAFQKWLFVNDTKGVYRIEVKGKTGQAKLFAPAKAFPTKPMFLNDVAVDEKGTVYVSDSGDLKGKGGAIYRITDKGKVTLVTNASKMPGLKTPNGLVLDGMSFLLLLDFGSGELSRVDIATGKATKIADGFEGGDGLAWDHFGQLFITSWKQGKMWGIARPGQKPVLISDKFESAADLCLSVDGNSVLIPDMKAGKIIQMPIDIPGHEVDRTPLNLELTVAFPKLKWTGWEGFSEDGKVLEHRPLMLTHAGDGSNRVFVPIQQGTIHVFPNDPKATQTKVFLDISKKVLYKDKQNEQGLLGLAFHPKYKKNGEFFVFYTLQDAKLINVLSRFRVSKDDPNKADPNSEEELFRIERPFWNHDGGTIAFGPDGYLYVALGDGGAANDPFKNGQNLKTLLGSILRIDIDSKSDGKKYGIPRDNPFVGRSDARPEIWAYGFRNVWRMSFDSKTRELWAADVGQNLYEEVNRVSKGGNFGWALREGLHPFSEDGVGPNKGMIEPVWEYHHDVGKSVTGGNVYRGKRLPQLAGSYVYGDYITGRIWAMQYDKAKKRVVANRPILRTKELILSFGEDQQGEIYLMAPTVSGQGIFRFTPTKKK